MTPFAVELPRGLRAALVRAARAAAPREACGLLIGRCEDGRARVERLWPARNIAARPDRFDVDPLDQLEAERAAEASGARVLGAWHSHVGAPAQPSPHDLAGGGTEGVALIVALPGGEVRAWSGSTELALAEPGPDA